jgi:hypothetical protein
VGLFTRRTRLSPADTTPAGTPLSEALPEAGDVVGGSGAMRVVGTDARHFAELIAARWANRNEVVELIASHPWGKGKPQDKVNFILYMAAQETITATVSGELKSLIADGGCFADCVGAPRR